MKTTEQTASTGACPQPIRTLVTMLEGCAWVDALALGGSRAKGTIDRHSDYDLYVYCNGTPVMEDRKKIAAEVFSYCEVDNRYWETEDDGILKGSATPVDLVYRSVTWMQDHLEGLLERSEVGTGYSTCLWYNVLNSKVLFDRTGKLAALVAYADRPYPAKLQQAILAKNQPLLAKALPNYRDQILKAAARKDLVAVNHRVAAFLASYFDVVFAMLKLPHPGEKRILSTLAAQGMALPEQMEHDVGNLLEAAASDREQLACALDTLCDSLDAWISGR